MDTPEEMMHQVGAFEPFEAKKLLELFEAEGIPFEIESDYSALASPSRYLQLSLGMYPEGSKLLVFVPESSLAKAEALLRDRFPV